MKYTQEELKIFMLINHPKRYKKFGQVQYRVLQSTEQIDTVIDGQLETTNTGQQGDIVLTGPKGEEYIISPEKFNSRYEIVTNEFAKPTGHCYAIEWEGDEIEFIASWGEKMICLPGDYICSPDANISEVYRIEREIFYKTYRTA